MLIGIIKETKIPPDSRVLLTPNQCSVLLNKYPELSIVVQPSPSRSYSDMEYQEAGIRLQEDLSNCDVLVGVKEQKIDTLLPNKIYFFFSHTAKEQEYNRPLLRAVVDKKIQLVDYEYLVKEEKRVIAFGRWAGIVGAHNGVLTWGKRTKKFGLKPMNQCKDFKEAQSYYKNLDLSHAKIVLTGTGRVANGSAEVLDKMNIRKVSSSDFLNKTFSEAVYCQLKTNQMFEKASDGTFENEFYNDPKGYISSFEKYTKVADIMINGIYWDNRAPAFFTKEDMKSSDFSIQVIADITCDIAPEASIPSTLKASTIAKPNFGYDVQSEKETEPFSKDIIDMMTVDNLPNELPRDASEDFGNQFMDHVIDELIENGEMINQASITTKEGKLNKPYLYLEDYINI